MNVDQLQTYFTEGRLLRRAWEDGEGRACAYVALYEPGARPETCPAADMPRWLAHLVPWLDDAGSEERWPETIRRLVALLRRLPDLDMERVRHLWLAAVVRDAMAHTSDGAVFAACERVIALHERAAAGTRVAEQEWAAAGAAARAAEAAARAAAEAAEAAA